MAQVCRNGSSHLRGNVYVHYKSLDSAVQAYHSINGRYFAGKRVLLSFFCAKMKIFIFSLLFLLYKFPV